MSERYKAMVLGSFVADALALGAHWIYDPAKIRADLGRVEDFLPPPPDSFHAGKADGQFTHYGDQAMLLLQFLDGRTDFAAGEFAQVWRSFMDGYDGYMDKASKQTLANMESADDQASCGSSSAELGGAVRMAPLLYFCRADFAATLSQVLAMTRLTHDSPTSLAAAEFLCRVTWEVLAGRSPQEGIGTALDAGVNDISLELKIRNALETAGDETVKVIGETGRACGAEQALPAVVHLVTSYPDDLERALIENVMAGGDSASRGMAAGMILGAYGGLPAVPERWLRDLAQYAKISAILDNNAEAGE